MCEKRRITFFWKIDFSLFHFAKRKGNSSRSLIRLVTFYFGHKTCVFRFLFYCAVAQIALKLYLAPEMGSCGKASILSPPEKIGGKTPEQGALLSVDIRILFYPPPNGGVLVCWIRVSLDAIWMGKRRSRSRLLLLQKKCTKKPCSPLPPPIFSSLRLLAARGG